MARAAFELAKNLEPQVGPTDPVLDHQSGLTDNPSIIFELDGGSAAWCP